MLFRRPAASFSTAFSLFVEIDPEGRIRQVSAALAEGLGCKAETLKGQSMSIQNGVRRRMARQLRDSKGGTPLVMVTAHDAGMARPRWAI